MLKIFMLSNAYLNNEDAFTETLILNNIEKSVKKEKIGVVKGKYIELKEKWIIKIKLIS